MGDFAKLWKAADKVVFSRTLATPSTARTRIEREFDPGAIRQLKAQAQSDLLIGGPDIAGQAIREGLVDECRLLIAPIAWAAASGSSRPTSGGSPS